MFPAIESRLDEHLAAFDEVANAVPDTYIRRESWRRIITVQRADEGDLDPDVAREAAERHLREEEPIRNWQFSRAERVRYNRVDVVFEW